MMFKTAIIVMILSLLFIPMSAIAHDHHGGGNGGGNGPGSGGGHGNGTYNDSSYFDPTTVSTFKGTLSENTGFYQQQGENNCTGGGMSYLFNANTGNSYYLMTGPWWYLEENGIELSAGLELIVTGSVVPPHNSYYADFNYIIVTELTVDGKTVQLRDDEGFPLWTSTDYGGSYYNCPTYSTDSFGNYSGKVISVRSRTNGPNADIGYELIIRTTNGNQRYRVFVAPQYYCEEIGFSCSIGDFVRLFGSEKGGAVVAQRIKVRGEKLHRLRTMKGEPLWIN